MAVVIEQFFLAGRFHATRWNQNPFEDPYGEWPPSPWRLLRALAARWFQYNRETNDNAVDTRDALLQALAGELPVFQLPTVTWCGQELRQYHPTALEPKFKYKKNPKTKKNELDYSFRQVSTTLVTDRYRVIEDRGRVVWIWQALILPREQAGLLEELLRRIHYFGRAESLTSMRLSQETQGKVNSNCVLRGDPSLAAVPVLAHRPDQPLDVDLLLAITGDKRLSNTPIPSGTRWYQTTLPAVPRIEPTRKGVFSLPRPQVARFALDSAVLPLVTETLPVAEAARRALIFHLVNVRGRAEYGSAWSREAHRAGEQRVPLASMLGGKDEHGRPRVGHAHAYYLPTDEDGDGRIDHLTIFAAAGFEPDELRAIDRLNILRGGRGGEERHPLRLLLLGLAVSNEYHPGPLDESQVWISATPYIATRHAKTRGRERIDLTAPQARAAFLAADLREQIRRVRPDLASIGGNASIEPLFDGAAFRVAERWRPIQFQRFRRKRRDDGGRRLSGAFRLTFPRPVRGPIALGWSSHFGMGLFVPSRESRQ